MRKTEEAKRNFFRMKVDAAKASNRAAGASDQLLGVAAMLESSSAGLYYLADAVKDVYDKLEEIDRRLPRK